MDSVGLANLAPRRVFEVIDRTFRVYRENFISFVALVAVVVVPYQIILYLFNQSTGDLFATENQFGDFNRSATIDPDVNLGAVCGLIIVALLYVFVNYVVVYSMITYISSENILGRSASIAEAFPEVSGRFFSLTTAWIAYFIFFVVLAIPLIIATACVVGIVGWPFFIYYLFVVGAFLTPVMVLENVGASFGISRSSALVRSRFWPIFGFYVGMTIILQLLQLVLGVVVAVIVGVTYSADAMMTPLGGGGSALVTALSTVVTIFMTPILPIGLTMMYYDTRVRVEGLDIALQSVDTPTPRPSDIVSPQPSIGPMTGQDILNIIIMTVVVLGICGVFYGIAFTLGSLAT